MNLNMFIKLYLKIKKTYQYAFQWRLLFLCIHKDMNETCFFLLVGMIFINVSSRVRFLQNVDAMFEVKYQSSANFFWQGL